MRLSTNVKRDHSLLYLKYYKDFVTISKSRQEQYYSWHMSHAASRLCGVSCHPRAALETQHPGCMVPKHI